MPVLPQGGHRIWCGLAGAQRQHHPRRPAQRQVVDQQGGQLIKQVRVVYPDHHTRPGGSGQQRVGGLAHQPALIRTDRAEHRPERAQRQDSSRGRGDRPSDQRSALLGRCERLPSQPSLSHPGRPSQHDACRAVPVTGQLTDEAQLLDPPCQRPLSGHAQDARQATISRQ